jgi:hypothetical protein
LFTKDSSNVKTAVWSFLASFFHYPQTNGCLIYFPGTPFNTCGRSYYLNIGKMVSFLEYDLHILQWGFLHSFESGQVLGLLWPFSYCKIDAPPVTGLSSQLPASWKLVLIYNFLRSPCCEKSERIRCYKKK